ncbi:Plug domain-containing protein [Pseudomonas sp. JG-B]|nr:Plug domain-containing protein [Pseudomonas sp. JG-B]MDH4653383.1 Plug domain-containing protein [Pseudomonas sp. BN606]MRK22385.1 Plug domain-containing protein [Pseudomonas sp. JG-B]
MPSVRDHSPGDSRALRAGLAAGCVRCPPRNLRAAPQGAAGLLLAFGQFPRFGAEEARLSIRGSGLQRTFHGRGLLLMQDGAPVNLADGSFDFQTIEPLTTDHIEVLRGANAWRYVSANHLAPSTPTAPSTRA